MARPFEIRGLKKTIGKLDRLPKEIVEELEAVMKVNAEAIAGDAARMAPVDLGFLRNGIRPQKLGPASYTVVSSAKYSPYIEFGTGALVNVPAGLEKYAMQFKGAGKK